MHCLQYETRVPVILISVQNFHVLPFSLPFQIHPALSVFVSYKTTYQSSIRRKAKFPNPFLFLLVYVSTSRRVERKKKKNRNNEGRGLDIFSKASVPSSGLSMHLIQVTRSSRPFVEKTEEKLNIGHLPPHLPSNAYGPGFSSVSITGRGGGSVRRCMLTIQNASRLFFMLIPVYRK